MIKFKYNGSKKVSIKEHINKEKNKYLKNYLISFKTKLKLLILIKNEKFYYKLLKLCKKV